MHIPTTSVHMRKKVYAEGMNQLSGREHLMQSLWNVMDAVGKVIQPILEAFQELFPPADGKRIYSVAEGLDELTKKLIISDETAEKIRKTAAGVFSVLRVGKDALTAIATGAGKLLTLAKPIGSVFLEAASGLGTFLSDITEGLHPLEKLGDWAQKFVDFIAPIFYDFGKVADKVFLQVADGAKNAFNQLDPTKVQQFITGGLGAGVLVSVKNFLSGMKSIGSSAKDIVEEVKNCISSLGEAVAAWKNNKNADTLMTIAKAIGIVAAALAVISLINPEQLGASVLAMTTSLGGLLGVLYTG